MAKMKLRAIPALIDNTIISTEPCVNCGAFGQPHDPPCPCGERYKQVQDIGGVPMEPLYGDALLKYFLE